MSFARMASPLRRSATTQCCLQARLAAHPLLASASFSTSAKVWKAEHAVKGDTMKLSSIPMPVGILTMNIPAEVTKTGTRVINVDLAVCGSTVQNVSVLSPQEPRLLGFTMRLHGNALYDAAQKYRDRGRSQLPTQCVISMLDAKQADIADAFARDAANIHLVSQHDSGSKAEKFNVPLFDKFDVAQGSGPNWHTNWCTARPPVLKECHVAYRCTFVEIKKVMSLLPQNEKFDFKDDEEVQASHKGGPGKIDAGSVELVNFVVRVEGVEETKAMSGVPLVIHHGAPLL